MKIKANQLTNSAAFPSRAELEVDCDFFNSQKFVSWLIEDLYNIDSDWTALKNVSNLSTNETETGIHIVSFYWNGDSKDTIVYKISIG